MLSFEQYPDDRFVYLTRADVVRACRSVDIVGTVEQALVLHTQGATVLPEEAYLGWTTPEGHAARCLAMPGALVQSDRQVLGLKTINASLGNPARGIPRSQGFTLLLDPETAQPRALMEAAYISAMRTAAVTAVAVRRLGVAEPRSLALLGCGTLAQAHLTLLLDELPTLSRIALHDLLPGRAADLAKWITALPGAGRLRVDVADDPRSCVRDAEVIVPVTTTTEGYLQPEWLSPGALVAHVSLDDLTEQAVLAADLVVVDDWGLVSADPRRLLGRMYRAGTLLDPSGAPREGTTPAPAARRVDGTLGDVLTGALRGRTSDTEIVVSNPFGMSILDVAVADQALAAATAGGHGRLLSL